jgi:hypothetical protein
MTLAPAMIHFALLTALALTLALPAAGAERWSLSPGGKHWEWVDPDRGQWRLNPGQGNGWTFVHPGEEPRLDPSGRWRWVDPR